MPRLLLRLALAASFACGAVTLTVGQPPVATPSASGAVERVAYHGWTDAWRLRNRHVEVIAVGEIGRVMSFRLLDGENVFWEDRSLDGQRGSPESKEWTNFGGDKTWPAPEAEWGRYTGNKLWRRPPAFDALPVRIHAEGATLVLTSPVDPFYGIRTVRRIALDPKAPVMTIETRYERVSGEPSKMGVWVISQFKHPVAVYFPAPTASAFPNGYYVFGDSPWAEVGRMGDLIVVTRDSRAPHKLGSEADRMLWVGENVMCLVSAPRRTGAEYPDRGASAEVYTNGDPKTYVELETLGELALLKPGDSMRHTSTYTLLPRRDPSLLADARRVLSVSR